MVREPSASSVRQCAGTDPGTLRQQLEEDRESALIVLDCRLPHAYENNHIRGARNVGVTFMVRRQLSVAEKCVMCLLFGTGESEPQACDVHGIPVAPANGDRALRIILYDDNTRTLSQLHDDSSLFCLLLAMQRHIWRHPTGRLRAVSWLVGGFVAFMDQSPDLCVLHPMKQRWAADTDAAPANWSARAWITDSATSPNQVLPYLFIGGEESSMNAGNLRALGITHVLNVAAECNGRLESAVRPLCYLQCPLNDTLQQSLFPVADDAIAFIGASCGGVGTRGLGSRVHSQRPAVPRTIVAEEARRAGGRVLVHCAQGVSRSAAVVIAYLMRTYDMLLNDALALVTACRPCVSPNIGFIYQLTEYGKVLAGRRGPESECLPLPAECRRLIQQQHQREQQRREEPHSAEPHRTTLHGMLHSRAALPPCEPPNQCGSLGRAMHCSKCSHGSWPSLGSTAHAD